MTKDNHKYGSNTDSRAADGTFGPTNPEGPGGSRLSGCAPPVSTGQQQAREADQWQSEASSRQTLKTRKEPENDSDTQ